MVLLVVLGLGFTALHAHAADGPVNQLNTLETPLAPALKNPATVSEVVAGATVRDPLGRSWQSDQWLTAGLQFLIRGKEALGWSLNISESGVQNSAIRATYQKVLTIVNSLFILGLLAVAGLWLFNVFIPRGYLRRVMLMYAMAVVFINFALPLNQLIIDGSNLVQKAFLTDGGSRIAIADIVRTPDYVEATAFTQSSATTLTHTTKTINLEFQKYPWEESATVGMAVPESRNQGQTPYQLRTNGAKPLVATITTLDPPVETVIFHLAMLALTGLAYMLLAVIFVLRVVILWALLILSPLLFFLAIFHATRGYFYNWLSWYGRWLFIGPLAALGIAIVVNIWKVAGLPITSTYAGDMSFGMLSSLAFYLPGRTAPNTLSTTGQMMEYMIFLAMLYVPVFFAFILTRQKHFEWAFSAVQEGVSRLRERERKSLVTQEKLSEKTETRQGPAGGFVNQFKEFFGKPFGKSVSAMMPTQLRTPPDAGRRAESLQGIETASSLLPQQLALADTKSLLGLLSLHPESRHAREESIAKMAFPERLTDVHEKHTVETVRQEIEKRAAIGEPEAILIQNEIMSYRSEKVTEKETVKQEAPPNDKHGAKSEPLQQTVPKSAAANRKNEEVGSGSPLDKGGEGDSKKTNSKNKHEKIIQTNNEQ